MTTSLLASREGDPLERRLFTSYFEEFYRTVDLDARGICAELEPDRETCGCRGLRRAARRFTLIDDEESGYRSVFVPYRRNEIDDTCAGCIATLRSQGPARRLLRMLQRYSVSLPGYQFDELRQRGDLDEAAPGFFVLKSEAQYDSVVGLLLEGVLTSSTLVV